MRILNITAQKPDSTGSGIYLSELMKGFHKMGHTQALLAGIYAEDEVILPVGTTFYPVYFSTEELPFAIAGMSDEMPYVSTRYCDMTADMTKTFRAAYQRRIQEALQDFQPEIILCHHLYYVTSLVRELAQGIPVYGICHGSDLRQIKKNPWRQDYIKRMIPTLDGIFALHTEQKEEICRLFGCRVDMVKVIGTGYNQQIFYMQPEIKGSDILRKKKEIRMIFAGKLSEKKGVISLLNCLNYLEKDDYFYKLTLAGGYGNEDEYREICRLAAQSNIEVDFAGKLNQQQLAKEMNACDLFLLPSFYEGLPLVVVEAMACGLKVICTDLPGIRPWLDSKVSNHQVYFIMPPKMEQEDEPLKECLPGFERELAEAIQTAAKDIIMERDGLKESMRPDLSQISWDGLCHQILEEIPSEKRK